MLPDDTRGKIKNITTGTILEGGQDNCTAIRNFLCSSFPTSTTVKKDFESKAIIKEKQAIVLESYAKKNNLWTANLPDQARYLTRGGEARVYLDVDNKNVIKVNDAVYYATWLEFFNSILLHNLIFVNTAYTFIGFVKDNKALCAILKQPFITSDAQVELGDVKKLLGFNGFVNSRRNDYVHGELGLILEDMHDENIIVNLETLFFIDTVFYTITPESI
ncbi:MAG TPA: hypothetical protein VFI06_04690 [Chitinophagaceae bacterium]|nr:hypothetical protein [Chitinophagaceae bacterium]